jgi:hypothetical protein
MSFLLLLWALVLTLRRPSSSRPLAAMIQAALVFQCLTLAQPSLIAGLPLVALLVMVFWRPRPMVRALTARQRDGY